VAGGWGGDSAGQGDPEQDEEGGEAAGPRGADGAGPEEDAGGGSAAGGAEAPARIGFRGFITLRRFKIRPGRKRREYVERLERIMAVCEEALSDPEAVEGAQLKAADVIIRAIRMGYAIVREVEVEDLERHAEEIKKRLEERRRGGGEGA